MASCTSAVAIRRLGKPLATLGNQVRLNHHGPWWRKSEYQTGKLLDDGNAAVQSRAMALTTNNLAGGESKRTARREQHFCMKLLTGQFDLTPSTAVLYEPTNHSSNAPN